MLKTYLIFDLGTGNSRAALVTSDFDVIGMSAFENKYYKDSEYEDAQYFVPEEWKASLFGACSELLKANPGVHVSGITASGARESIVLYDKEGKAFLGLPNIDNRGRRWVGGIGDKGYIYEKTGRWVTEDFPAAKLLGLMKKKPDEYGRTAKITSLSEWIGEIFTGKIVIEPSQACETQLFDIDRMEWSDTLCRYYGIDANILPDVQNSGTLLGTVKHDIAAAFDLPLETPFIVGGADTQIAVKSTRCNYNDTVVVSGTTSPVATLLDRKFYDREERCWTDCNLSGKGYQVETNPGVTGLNFQRFKDNFLTNVPYSVIDKAVAEKESFLCTASFSSLLFSERRSLKTGGFIMKSPFDANFDIYDMAWAVLADIACSIFEQYNNLCTMIPNRKDYILCCGGGFKSPLLCQMLSDLSAKHVILYYNYDKASAVGCAEICNEYFNIRSAHENQKDKTYRPGSGELIKRYHDIWRNNRMLLNK